MNYPKQILEKELYSCEKALQKSQDAFYDNRITYTQKTKHRENLTPKIEQLKKVIKLINENHETILNRTTERRIPGY